MLVQTSLLTPTGVCGRAETFGMHLTASCKKDNMQRTHQTKGIATHTHNVHTHTRSFVCCAVM